MIKLKINNCNTILIEKQQKISVLSSGKIDKYEYRTGEEILPSDQSRIIEQVKFTCYPGGKAFEKQIKTIEEQGKEQVEALKVLKPEDNKEDIKSAEGIFPKEMSTNKIKTEIDEIKKWEEKKKKDFRYETKNMYMIFNNMKQ